MKSYTVIQREGKLTADRTVVNEEGTLPRKLYKYICIYAL